MARHTRTLLAFVLVFVTMTAFTCPPELCELLPPDLQEDCLSGSPELSETSDNTEAQLAAREEPSDIAQPETSAPEPERDGS